MLETHAYGPEELEQLDKKYVWHPFTQMADWLQEEPLIVAEGQGNYLIDVHGRHYLDGVSSLWVTVHGHRRAEINRAIIEQLGRIAHTTFLGLTHPTAVQLAERLINAGPAGLARVFYSDNGSSAVEIALKMGFQYWQQRREPRPLKSRFISFCNGYHGDTLGAVSVGGIDLFHKVYRPLLFPNMEVHSAYCYRCHLGKEYPSCHMLCLVELEELMERHHEEVVAVVMEPLVQAAGGMIVFPPGYTRRVREMAAKYDILFIADEVATGFGRSGALFACQRESISPDLMTIAKGITGGYLPLAATLTTQEIFDAFSGDYAEKKTFFHGHTYTANPLACAAALANLDIFAREKTLDHLQDKIAKLEEGLKSFRDLKHVGDVRQLGFIVGIEMVKDRDTKEPYPYEARMGIKVIQEARRRGLVIRPLGDVIVLMPPLSITSQQLGNLLDITYQSIKAVTEG